MACTPKCHGPDIASPAQIVVDNSIEEDYTINRKLVSVVLRVKFGDFLKTLCTNIDNCGTVKNISSDGEVTLVTESGVSVFEHGNMYLLTYTIGCGHCISVGPNELNPVLFPTRSVCGQVGDAQDAGSHC